jgi:hypothetical protein
MGARTSRNRRPSSETLDAVNRPAVAREIVILAQNVDVFHRTSKHFERGEFLHRLIDGRARVLFEAPLALSP